MNELTARQQARAAFLKSQGRTPKFGQGGNLQNDQLYPGGGQPQGATGQISGFQDMKGGRLNKIKDEKSRGMSKDDKRVGVYNADKDLYYGNPTIQNGPFGSRNMGVDAEGNIVIDTKLDPAQQAILDKENAFSIAAKDAANSYLGKLGGPFQFDFTAERGRLEDQAYGKLTRDLEQNYQRGRNEKMSELAAKGYSMESPFAAQEMQRYDQNYERTKQEARQSAAEMGGNELSRSYGVASGVRNQNMNDIGALSSMGPGLRMSEFQGFNPVDFGNLPFPSQNQLSNEQIGISKEQNAIQKAYLEIAKKAANKPSGGSGDQVFYG